MPHSTNHDSNEPLLGGHSKSLADLPAQPLSSTTRTAIQALSAIRIVTGAACLVAPGFTCGLFRYAVPAEHGLLVRMFGARDAVLGELLLTAEDKERADGGRREIRRAIWAGIGADVLDMGSLVYGVAMGHVGKTTGGLLGACAVGALGLGFIGLRGVQT